MGNLIIPPRRGMIGASNEGGRSMTREYQVSLLSCQFCVGKNHCRQCHADIAQALLAMEGVTGAEVSAAGHTARVTYAEGADPADIEDRMDASGVFLS